MGTDGDSESEDRGEQSLHSGFVDFCGDAFNLGEERIEVDDSHRGKKQGLYTVGKVPSLPCNWLTSVSSALPWSDPTNLNSHPIIASPITYCLADIACSLAIQIASLTAAKLPNFVRESREINFSGISGRCQDFHWLPCEIESHCVWTNVVPFTALLKARWYWNPQSLSQLLSRWLLRFCNSSYGHRPRSVLSIATFAKATCMIEHDKTKNLLLSNHRADLPEPPM